jgi:D-amino-acid dehydrogenase
MVAALVGAAGRLGVQTRTETSARAFRASGNAIRTVETNTGPIDGDEFLVAAGAWSARLLSTIGLRVPIEAGRGYGVTIQGPRAQLQRATYLAESRIACTPFDGALRLAGTMEFSGLDAPPERRRPLSRSLARRDRTGMGRPETGDT